MSRKKKILIVEDDRSIAVGLRDLLQGEGFAVALAEDGREALKRTFTYLPDLMLLDVNLPSITGLHLCREIRSKGFRSPVIILSARAEQADKLMGLEAGADDYVTKPFDAREVLARVRAQLRVVERMPEPARPNAATHAGDARVLRSVMFTDIQDFAKKMNANEKLTLALLEKHNVRVNRMVTRNGGKVIEIIGDAFLVSFDSALKAVQCAAAIQRDLKNFNQTRKGLGQLRVRIGIHLGDVIEMDGKLRGDTVNIAARLQQTARAGHVSISGSVYEAVKGKLRLAMVRLGKRQMKNIRQPITVYQVNV